jgi:hypothetical protein
MGLEISGFPGVLLLAAQSGFISPEELKERPEICPRRELIVRRHLFKKFTPWQNSVEAIHETQVCA